MTLAGYLIPFLLHSGSIIGQTIWLVPQSSL